MIEIQLPTIAPVATEVAAAVQQRLNEKTKPRGSLGRLEQLACDYCAARGKLDLEVPEKAVVVMAADHGIARRGTSAYPQEVTAQMVENFVDGGAAINVLTRQAGAHLTVVDMGIASAVVRGDVRDGRIAAGTADMSEGPAMTLDQARLALEFGLRLANELADRGFTVVALGEMGIGNTSAASALTAVLTDRPVAEVTGSGTGLTPDGVTRKVELLEQALRVNREQLGTPFSIMAALGGFEIAGLCGLALGAASRRMLVMVDGFIALSAALCAAAMEPAVRGYLVAAHRSTEPGHRVALQALELQPLLDLQLRLGEGSGAALAFPLLDSAVAIVREMATFASAQVSDSGA